MSALNLALEAAAEAATALADAQAHYDAALCRAREAGASWPALSRALGQPQTTARRHTLAALAAAGPDAAPNVVHEDTSASMA